jgi:hypothetical protein
MNMKYLFVGAALACVAGQNPSHAQKSPPAAPELKPATATSNTSQLTEAVLGRIKNIEEKMIAVAEDFPEDLYNTYRPKGNKDVRTAAEILLHVAALNSRQAFNLASKEQKDALFAAGKVPSFPLDFRYVSKQDTVAKVTEAFAAVRKAIHDNPNPENLDGWLWVIAHSSEHFGNLVSYYRANGLVPPTSRQ